MDRDRRRLQVCVGSAGNVIQFVCRNRLRAKRLLLLGRGDANELAAVISNARGAAVLQHPGIQNGSVVLNPCGRVITARRRSELGPRLRLVETVAFGQINLRSPSARSRARVSPVLALVVMGGQFGLMTFVATAEGLLRGNSEHSPIARLKSGRRR